MPNLKLWELAIIYNNGRRYFIPFEIIEKYVKPDIIDKIKTEILSEVQKL